MVHRHRVKTTRTVGYTGPVAQFENREAHGGVCHVDTCSCGATRRTNSTGMGRDERGPWIRPSEGRPEAERDAVVVSMRLQRDTLGRLDSMAERRGLSRGATVAALVMEAK